jgi:hypothetical protein
MLVEAILLTKRADAFTSDYTPVSIIRQILERESESNEWQDEITLVRLYHREIGVHLLPFLALSLRCSFYQLPHRLSDNQQKVRGRHVRGISLR